MKKLILFIFAILFANTGFSQINLQNGLVGYFNLDGNANDGSTTAINGVNNGATVTTGYEGISNTAMNFMETQNDFIDAGTNMRGITNQVSVSFWMKTSTTGYDHLVSKYHWPSDKGFLIGMYYGPLLIQGRDGSGNGVSGTSSANYNDGQWHHVVVVINQNQWDAYVDCELVISITTGTSSPDLTTTVPLTFGKYDYGDSGDYRYYNGDLDEIRIYNRALNSDEICALCGMNNLSTSLVGYFDLAGNTNDSSPTAINGVNNGATATTGFDGISNSAMHFTETQSDFIDAGTNMRSITNTVSVSFWMKSTTTGYDHMVSKYHWPSDKGFLIGLYYGPLLLQGRDGSGNGISGTSTANYNDGQWHNVVVVINQNQWDAYVDCELVISITTGTSSPDLTTTVPLTFGKYDYGDSGDYRYYEGDLDEIRIYNRALSTNEICYLCKTSVLLGVEENENTKTDNYKIFPNPSTDFVSVSGIEISNYKLVIKNIMGQNVMTNINSNSIDISALSSGIYTIELIDEKQNILFTKKFVRR